MGSAANGELKVNEIAPGSHTLEVHETGYKTYRGEIQVPEGGQVSVSASLVALDAQQPEKEPPAKSDRSPASLNWLGFTLIGVGAASVAAMAASWVVIKNVDDDPLFDEYRRRVGESSSGAEVADVCQQAKEGNDYSSPGEAPFGRLDEITKMCRRASLFEVLQYVFLGTALAGGATGTYLLIREANRPERSQEAASAPKLTLWPTFSGISGRITAKVTF